MGDLRTQFSILRQRSFTRSICTYSMGDLRTQFSILRQRSFTRSICTYSMGDLRTQFSILRSTFIHPLDLHERLRYGLMVNSAPSSPSSVRADRAGE